MQWSKSFTVNAGGAGDVRGPQGRLQTLGTCGDDVRSVTVVNANESHSSCNARWPRAFEGGGPGARTWWYTGDRDLKSIQQTGVATNAVVLKKTADSLQVRFTDQSGRVVERTQKGGISVQEFAAVTENQPAPILYTPRSQTIYLASSYQRQLHDNIYFLVFPGVLFLIGSACWFFLRKYRVHPREGSVYEYVTDETGKVVLDDAANPLTKGLRNYTTFSKLFDLFRR